MIINNETIIKDNNPLIREKSLPVSLPLSKEDEQLLREMYQYVQDSIDEEKAFQECELLRFDGPNGQWLDFVAENRQGIYQGEKYDMIYGAVANDDVYRTLTLYMTDVLSKEQTLESLKIRKLFNQLVFATDKSLQFLKFEGSEQV